jgi:hypothetical protein
MSLLHSPLSYGCVQSLPPPCSIPFLAGLRCASAPLNSKLWMRFRGTPTHLHTYVKNDPRDEIYNMSWPIHFVNADRPGYRVPEFLWSFRIYYLKKNHGSYFCSRILTWDISHSQVYIRPRTSFTNNDSDIIRLLRVISASAKIQYPYIYPSHWIDLGRTWHEQN